MFESCFRYISYTCNFSEKSQLDRLGHCPNHRLNKTSSTTLVNERYKAKFFSPKSVNLPRRNLTSHEIFLFSKRQKFVPTSRCVNKALINKELEACGRKLRIM